MPNFVYLNNKYVNFKDAKIHIEDRGFQFSDSVYEVITVFKNKLIASNKVADSSNESDDLPF